MPCYSPLLGYKSRANGGFTFRREESAGEKMTVACGGCLGCRLDRSRMWASRIVHEAELYDDNCFITLTYRDVEACNQEQLDRGWHIPADGSLNKQHFQKFMKRLRKMFKDRRIRYYHCGEYGDKLHRPHYHACLFNFCFADIELLEQREGNFLFVSETLNQLWPYGFATVGELTFQSAAYCARYVTKKVTGPQSHDHYTRVDIKTGEVYQVEPEYCTMSRGYRCKEHRGLETRPVSCKKCSGGIGADWFEKYKKDVFPSDELPVPGSGVLKKVPRYYEEIHAAGYPGEIEDVKRRREKFMKAHADEYGPQRLMSKYKVKKAQVNLLKRGLE